MRIPPEAPFACRTVDRKRFCGGKRCRKSDIQATDLCQSSQEGAAAGFAETGSEKGKAEQTEQ